MAFTGHIVTTDTLPTPAATARFLVEQTAVRDAMEV